MQLIIWYSPDDTNRSLTCSVEEDKKNNINKKDGIRNDFWAISIYDTHT